MWKKNEDGAKDGEGERGVETESPERKETDEERQRHARSVGFKTSN